MTYLAPDRYESLGLTTTSLIAAAHVLDRPYPDVMDNGLAADEVQRVLVALRSKVDVAEQRCLQAAEIHESGIALDAHQEYDEARANLAAFRRVATILLGEV